MIIKKYLPPRHKPVLVIFVAVIVLLQSSICTAALRTLGVGTDGPKFSLQEIKGDKQNFSSLKGDKLTILLFWASWSRQSEKALKQMEKLYVKYKDQGLSVIGINVERQTMDDKVLADIKGAIERLKVSFPILIDRGLIAFHDYGVIAVPTTVILDKYRKIVFVMSGFPLVGTRDMIHFVTAVIEGKKIQAEVAQRTGYHPDKRAVRYWNMGIKALKSKRSFNSSENLFKKAIAADPNWVFPYLSLGRFYEKQNDFKQAGEQFQKALTRDPSNVKALSSMGLVLMKEGGSLDEAKRLLEKAININESYTPSYYYLGYLLGKEGDTKKAAELFAGAEKINPMDYHINMYRGMMYEEQNNMEQATRSYKKALKQLLNL